VIAGVLRRRGLSGSALPEPGAGERYGAPQPVQVSRATAVQLLLDAVEGLPLDGPHRGLLLRAEAHWDPATVAVLAELLEMARIEGPAVASQAPAGPAVGWATVCVPCGVRPVPGPVTMPEAESAARVHDRERHAGLWTAEVMVVDVAGRPAASPVGGVR
jgi:hypothetical protein